MMNLKNVKFGALLVLLFSASAYGIVNVQKQKQITAKLEQFLNIKQDSKKALEDWIDEIKALIQNEKDLEGLLGALEAAKETERVEQVEEIITDNLNKAPLFLKMCVLNMMRKKIDVKQALKTRALVRKPKIVQNPAS